MEGKLWYNQERPHFVHTILGSAASRIRGQIRIDFVTSDSGSALIGYVHLQSSELIAQGHDNSRRAAGTRPA